LSAISLVNKSCVCNGNGSYGTELQQRYNGTAERQLHGNGMVETRHHSIHRGDTRSTQETCTE